MLVDSHTHHKSLHLSVQVLRRTELANKTPPTKFFAAGIHPWDVTTSDDVLRACVKELALDPNCVAIGETGLDRVRPVNWEAQKDSLLWHWDLAEELHLPLVLHLVRSSSDLMHLLKHRRPQTSWQWHDFSGPVEIIKSCLKFQPEFYFSFSPRGVRRSNFKQLWEAVPAERRLLETDDSNMELEEIYRTVQPPEDLLEANFKRLFALTRRV